MGIYGDILFIESNIISSNHRIITTLYDLSNFYDQLLNIIRCSEVKSDNIDTKKALINFSVANSNDLKNSMNEIIYQNEELKKQITLTKKDITMPNLEQIKYLLALILKQLNKISNIKINHDNIVATIESLGIYFSMNYMDNYTIKIKNLSTSFIDEITPLFVDTMTKIDNDIIMFKESKSGKKISDILGLSHIHKLDTSKEIDGRKVLFRFINKIDFSKDKYGGEYSALTLEEYVRRDCDMSLTFNNNEKDLLFVKNMTARQMELRVLEILRNTFLVAVDSSLGKINKSVKKVNVTLNNKLTQQGSYDSNSSSTEIFIQITLNLELLRALEFNKTVLYDSNNIYKTGLYQTIIHELFHSNDYILTNHPEDIDLYKPKNYFEHNNYLESIVKKISNKKSSKRTQLLAQILVYCRSEGLAGISKLFAVVDYTGNYANIKTPTNLSLDVFHKYSLSNLVSKKDLVESDVVDIYDSGVTHTIGEIMAIVIFLDSTRGKFLYSKQPYSSRNAVSSSILFNENVREILRSKSYILSIDNKLFKPLIDNFIQKLNLMPPHLFLEKYELACKNFDIEPIFSKKDFD